MMSKPTVILHQAVLQVEPVRLRLPQALSAFSKSAPQAAPTALQAGAPAVTAPSAVQDERMLKLQYDQGFQAGLAKAQQAIAEKSQQEIEQRARVLAGEMLQAAMPKLKHEAEQQHQKSREALAQHQALFEQLLRRMPSELNTYLSGAEDDILGLAFDVICRVLGEQAATAQGLRDALAQALKAWHGRAPLSVHLHPDDLSLLKADAESLQMLAAAGFNAERSSLRWVSDPKVQLGGCLLRSSEGALDARLETQMEALKNSLRQTREARQHAGAHASAEGQRP